MGTWQASPWKRTAWSTAIEARSESVKKPIVIEIKHKIQVIPEQVFESEVVKSGNGAVIKAFKRHIGKKAVVIIKEGEKHD